MDYQLLTILAQGGDCSGEGAYWCAQLKLDPTRVSEADRKIYQPTPRRLGCTTGAVGFDAPPQGASCGG